MAVVEGNVRKFLKDHLVSFKEQEEIFEKFFLLAAKCGCGGAIPLGFMQWVLDSRASQFIKELSDDPEHAAIAVFEMQKARAEEVKNEGIEKWG